MKFEHKLEYDGYQSSANLLTAISKLSSHKDKEHVYTPLASLSRALGGKRDHNGEQ